MPCFLRRLTPVENAADAHQKSWKKSKDRPNKEQQSYYKNLPNNQAKRNSQPLAGAPRCCKYC